MKIGIIYFPTASTITPGALGQAMEERGFESLWLPDHSHIPLHSSPWPGGAPLPRQYYELLDPTIGLAAAAATTTKLRLGTAVALVIQRDPIQLAKTIASLDVLSGGRIEVGVGAGWNLPEMRNHGTDPATRFRLLRERVEAMKAIWTQEQAEYHGRHVEFGPLLAWPKPVQQPHPRIHVAGAAPGALGRVVCYGDGWIPLAGRSDADFVQLASVLREQAQSAGRDPTSLEITVCGAPPNRAVLEAYREGGIDRVLFGLPHGDEGTAIAALDKLAALL